MTPLDRLAAAVHILRDIPGACWVCANRGHHHVTGKCFEVDTCPCAQRRLWPRNPVWVGSWAG